MTVRSQGLPRPFFAEWAEPLEAEPAHGLFVRVSNMNGQPSTPQVAFQADIDGRYLDPDQCLDLMLRHPVRGSAQLVFDTPRIQESGVVLRDHEFRRRQWSAYFRRYCPRCLAASGHHRAWFDLVFVRVCPVHGVPLDGGRFDDRQVSWVGTDILYAGADYIPDAAFDAKENLDARYEAYMLGRLDFGPRHPDRTLDAHAVADVADAVWGVGGLAVFGARWGNRPLRVEECGQQSQRAGFSILAGDDASLVDALGRVRSERAEKANPRSGLGVTGLFGGAYEEFKRSGNPLLERVVDAMVEVARADGRLRRSKSMLSRGEVPLGRMTLTEAKKELDLTFDCLVKLATAVLYDFDRPAIGERVHLSAEDVAVLRIAKSTAVSPTAAQDRLGIGPVELRALVKAGRMSKFRGLYPARSSSDFYLETDVALIEDACSAVRSPELGRPDGVAPVAAARLQRTTTADLLLRFLSGETVPVGRVEGLPGFKALRFRVPEGSKVISTYGRRRWIVAHGGMTYGEVAARTGIHASTVPKLVAAGYLEIVDASVTGTGRKRVPEKSVSSFIAEFVPSAQLARSLHCEPRDVARVLCKKGFCPIELPVDGTPATAIFRRSDLRHVATAVGHGASGAFERFLADRIAGRGSTYHCQVAKRDGGPLVVRNSMRTLWIEIRAAGGAVETVVHADRKRSKRRFRAIIGASGSLKREGFEVLAHGDELTVSSRNAGVDQDDASTWAAAGDWVVARLEAIRRAIASKD